MAITCQLSPTDPSGTYHIGFISFLQRRLLAIVHGFHEEPNHPVHQCLRHPHAAPGARSPLQRVPQSARFAVDQLAIDGSLLNRSGLIQANQHPLGACIDEMPPSARRLPEQQTWATNQFPDTAADTVLLAINLWDIRLHNGCYAPGVQTAQFAQLYSWVRQ